MSATWQTFQPWTQGSDLTKKKTGKLQIQTLYNSMDNETADTWLLTIAQRTLSGAAGNSRKDIIEFLHLTEEELESLDQRIEDLDDQGKLV